jgi:hypothetical protein
LMYLDYNIDQIHLLFNEYIYSTFILSIVVEYSKYNLLGPEYLWPERVYIYIYVWERSNYTNITFE